MLEKWELNSSMVLAKQRCIMNQWTLVLAVVVLCALWIVATICIIKQIRLAIKTKTVSAKLVVAVLVLVYVAYTNIKSFLL